MIQEPEPWQAVCCLESGEEAEQVQDQVDTVSGEEELELLLLAVLRPLPG